VSNKYGIEFARKRHEKWIKEGRGTGTGATYSSWIKAQEFASLGDESQKSDGRHRRAVLALSQIEQRLFDILDCNPDILEIYDQFPLEPGETQKIADSLGIKHPTAVGSNYLFVMTSDFVVDFRTPAGTLRIPFQAKSASALADHRNAEKLEIERLYWHAKGARLRIVERSKAPRFPPASARRDRCGNRRSGR